MNKNILSVALAVLGIATALAPVSALAYLSPEQVFGSQSLTLQPAPPTQREGEQVIEQQQQRAAERRAAEHSQLQPVDAEPVDTYVPDTSAQPLDLFDQNATYERRQERIDNERSTGGPTIIIGGDSTITDSNGNVLHSGAPRVTATGPESMLAFATMLLAGVSTFLYAQIRARRMALVS
ncbi:MAG: hypothetical protein KBA40_01310 [Candidatus Peribacteraceae bacterium]|nr:hypothetical protein [Candidatus Peribacteraceae bacterium]MBP9850825.1 hypothetical protein [Candidatus Peribacteraceae bacterium]